jgi:hypothetical protein
VKLVLFVLLVALGALGTPTREPNGAAYAPRASARGHHDDSSLSPETTGLAGREACAESRRAAEAIRDRRPFASEGAKELDGSRKHRRSLARVRASALPTGFLPPSLTYLRRNGPADANGARA